VWRVVVSGAGSAYDNMAVDEALFIHAGEEPSIRFYSWDSPACSIGYFQRVDELINRYHLLTADSRFVRRMTGGGLVRHGEGLTFSVTCRAPERYFGATARESYHAINTLAMQALGVESIAAAALAADRPQVPRSVNCFAEPSPYDILVNGRKAGGASQRRSNGRLLHQSEVAIAGMAQAVFVERFTRTVRDALGQSCVQGALSAAEQQSADSLRCDKYRTDEWNRMR